MWAVAKGLWVGNKQMSRSCMYIVGVVAFMNPPLPPPSVSLVHFLPFHRMIVATCLIHHAPNTPCRGRVALDIPSIAEHIMVWRHYKCRIRTSKGGSIIASAYEFPYYVSNSRSETWFLALREVHTLQMSENKVFRKYLNIRRIKQMSSRNNHYIKRISVIYTRNALLSGKR